MDGDTTARIHWRSSRGLKPVLRGELRQFFALGGLRFREGSSNAILLRSDRSGADLITALALMVKTGTFRVDARARISHGGTGLDTTMLRPMRDYATKSGLTASAWDYSN